MSEGYDAGEEVFTFDDHKQGYGGPTYIAVDVKVHKYDPLPEKYLRRLRLLSEEDPKLEETLSQHATDSVSESWWEWAHDLAKERDLGTIYSAGRSGGWLVLDDYTASVVEDWCHEVKAGCRHCERPEREHAAGGKCLFAATQFDPNYDVGSLTRLRTLKTFCQEIEESIQRVYKDYDHELKYLIDERFGEWLREKRAARGRIQKQTSSSNSLSSGGLKR